LGGPEGSHQGKKKWGGQKRKKTPDAGRFSKPHVQKTGTKGERGIHGRKKPQQPRGFVKKKKRDK